VPERVSGTSDLPLANGHSAGGSSRFDPIVLVATVRARFCDSSNIRVPHVPVFAEVGGCGVPHTSTHDRWDAASRNRIELQAKLTLRRRGQVASEVYRGSDGLATPWNSAPDLRKSPHHSALAHKDRRRSAAVSAVMSRCGVPSISNPTMNFRTFAERSKGG